MKKVHWDIETIARGLGKFFETHKRYPTSQEIDAYEFLPSSRQIQRRFGGLVALRKQLALTGPQDFTKGSYSSDRAHLINKRGNALEQEVYEYLVGCFGEIYVHREYFFSDDKRTRTDFFIYSKNGNFSIDVFYPKDRHNLIGCLNSKMRTYSDETMLQYPVIFLMMNPKIPREEIDSVLSMKKKKLHPYQKIMTFPELKKFAKEKIPL